MAATKQILVSLHGRKVGQAANGQLVVNGETVVTQDDAGSQRLVQGSPGTLNATGTLTAALIKGSIVTSTTAAAVAATLDTATAMDTALPGMAVGEAFDWSAIATGANAFTVTAAAGHTLVGNGAVATVTSGRFRTRKSAASTYITYRLS